MNETELLKAYGMAEDELLIGITDALTIGGWRWTHARRSDLAVSMGHQGFPDVFAVHPTRMLAIGLELKTDRGRATPEQLDWLASLRMAGIWTALIRPADYDRILELVLGGGDARGLTQRQLVAGEWELVP